MTYLVGSSWCRFRIVMTMSMFAEMILFDSEKLQSSSRASLGRRLHNILYIDNKKTLKRNILFNLSNCFKWLTAESSSMSSSLVVYVQCVWPALSSPAIPCEAVYGRQAEISSKNGWLGVKCESEKGDQRSKQTFLEVARNCRRSCSSARKMKRKKTNLGNNFKHNKNQKMFLWMRRAG